MKLVPSQEREMCESVSVEERLAEEGIYDETKKEKSVFCIFDLNSKLC